MAEYTLGELCGASSDDENPYARWAPDNPFARWAPQRPQSTEDFFGSSPEFDPTQPYEVLTGRPPEFDPSQPYTVLHEDRPQAQGALGTAAREAAYGVVPAIGGFFGGALGGTLGAAARLRGRRDHIEQQSY
jgi:hypothetical protein